MRGARAGNAVEVKVARLLDQEGWLVGSRRHIGGAGDLLAARGREVALIEVKSTAGGPYERFGPAERAAMFAVRERRPNLLLALYWWPPKFEGPIVYDSSVWPS